MKLGKWINLALCGTILAGALLPSFAQTPGSGSTVGKSPTNKGTQLSKFRYADKAKVQAQVSGYATVLLDAIPGDAWPLTVNTDGSITVAYNWFDASSGTGGVQAGIWRTGALLVNDPPQFLYSDHGDVWIAGFNGNGWIVAKAESNKTVTTGPYTYDEYKETFIAYWTPALGTALTVHGRVLKSYNVDDSRDNLFKSSALLLSFDGSLVADIVANVWLDNYGYFDGTIDRILDIGITGAGSTIESYNTGWDEPPPVIQAVYGSNAMGQYIGKAMAPDGDSYYFAVNKVLRVTYLPLSINDTGSILGDDIPNAVLTAKIYKGDRVAAWLLQSAQGQRVTKPFVAIGGGMKSYLQGIAKATDVYVTGFDESGNVYGSLTPGTKVIWVANPADWGLPAGTLPYTPIPWLMPVLPGNLTTAYGLRPAHKNGGIELGIATGTVIQRPTPNNDNTATTYTGDFPFTQVPAELRVDFNRDGKIDTSDAVGASDREFVEKSLPYCFWINDDHDSGEESVKDDDIPGLSTAQGANFASSTVNGIRDLIDYFPIYLDIGQLLKLLPPGPGLTYKLVQADGALNFVYTDLKPGNVGDYLRKVVPASGLKDNAHALGSAPKTQITAAGVPFDATWLAKINSHGQGVVLIDGRRATQNPLQLVVDDQDGNRLVTLELPLSIASVENMFRRQNDRNIPMVNGPIDGVSPRLDQPSNYPDDFTNGTNLVLVHGYNWGGNEARGFAAEMFKRFWWSGSRARFIAYFWYGNESQTTLLGLHSPVTPDFPINVVNALLTGGHLNTFLTGLPGQTVLVAQSLGNMVCARTLTLPGAPLPRVANYFMLDAAIPAEAISASERTNSSLSLMPNADWTGYPARLWASNWYQVFQQSGVADNRAQLTWQNLFSALPSVTNVTNFFSTGDQVLVIPPDNSTPSVAQLRQQGTLAWVAQEKLKGSRLLDPLTHTPVVHIRDVYGGWGFNTDDWNKSVRGYATGPYGTYSTTVVVKLDPGDVSEASVPTTALATRPFFRRFQTADDRYNDPNGGHYDGAVLLLPPGDPNGSAQGAYFPTEAKLLGEAIPALSFAVGSNSVAAINVGTTHNFNLTPTSTDVGFESGWPTSRGSNHSWLHSDYINVAYSYVFPLYDKIVTTGGLK